VKDGSAVTMYLLCSLCLLEKQHAALSEKDAISGVHVSPGSADALVRSAGKKH